MNGIEKSDITQGTRDRIASYLPIHTTKRGASKIGIDMLEGMSDYKTLAFHMKNTPAAAAPAAAAASVGHYNVRTPLYEASLPGSFGAQPSGKAVATPPLTVRSNTLPVYPYTLAASSSPAWPLVPSLSAHE